MIKAMYVSPCSSIDGFPDQTAKSINNLETEIQEGKLKAFFMNIPYGNYSNSILHDENGNGQMDTNWVGIPKEGYGVSNNARASFGPPGFDDAIFSLDAKEVQLHITIQY